MDKHALWKWLLLIGLVSFSLWVVTPPKDKIQLGLDLKGGTSFIVKIDEQAVKEDILAHVPDITDDNLKKEMGKVLNGAQDRAVEVIRNRIDSLGISEPVIYPGKDNRIIIQLPGIDEDKRKEAEDSIKNLAFLEFRMVHEDNAELVAKLFDNNQVPKGYKIISDGGQSYYVRDKNSLSDEKMDVAYFAQRGRFHAPSKAYELLLNEEDVRGEKVYTPVFVKRRTELTGDNLKDAWVDLKATGQAVIKLKFDGKGAKKFAETTSSYAPGGDRNPNPNNYRRLAIVLDGTLYSAPRINDAIFSGSAEISGSFTRVEAERLANVLRAGSLPAPVKIVETRFVDPSLGQDSIDSGLRAIILGGITVLVFMLVYYMFSGLIADIALLLNMILLPLGMIIAAGFLSMGHVGGGGVIKLPVLTLPGIAGILLTIGMAVDANVLIFERIREEAGTGKRLWTSITAGYDRAFITIMDANLTTLLTGIILFIFGSGPIRGFAITLCAGIIVSMYTALVVTKMLFATVANKKSEKALKMLRIIKETSVDFVSLRKIAAVISIALIVGTWGWMVARGVQSPNKIFGVDFTGGASITYNFENRVDVDVLRSALDKAGIMDANIQYQSELEKGGDSFLLIKASDITVDGEKTSVAVEKCMAANFADAGFVAAQVDEVGPQIGKELQGRAIWAIAMALLGIVIYVSWRFELGFAIGAIVALAHDVFITVGIYTLFGRQLSLPIVAALLTIVGYSVNDTIVVFDRIREDLKLKRNMTFKDICNLSINQTLSRTILTSFTTLITVVMLLVFGGGAIFDFALALCIGIVVGTYSSIFVATPVVLLWYRDKKPDLGGKVKV
jgi:SecD/SecF fusion protein